MDMLAYCSFSNLDFSTMILDQIKIILRKGNLKELFQALTRLLSVQDALQDWRVRYVLTGDRTSGVQKCTFFPTT